MLPLFDLNGFLKWWRDHWPWTGAQPEKWVAKTLYAVSVAKDFATPEINDDKFGHSIDRQYIAIADGATTAFGSGKWAELLVNAAVELKGMNTTAVAGAIKKYFQEFDFDELTWSQQAAFEKGSCATFASAKFNLDGTVDFFAVGDSQVMVFDDDKLVFSFPYESVEQFDRDPQMLSTQFERNESVGLSTEIEAFCKTYDARLLEAPTVILATDAMAKWVMTLERSGSVPLSVLKNALDEDKFNDFVIGRRKNGEMRVDDTTVIVCSYGRE